MGMLLMATLGRIHFLSILLLFVSCRFGNKSSVYGAREAPNSVYNVISMDSLRPPSTCSSSSSGSKGAKVVHRHGPCSPLGQSLTLKDQSRVKLSLTHAEDVLGVGDYVVTVGLGSPKQEATLILDTGSDLTWTQCKPCSDKCYHQSKPMFDPSASSTYSSCSSCSPYNIHYQDGSNTRGHYAYDTLTLPESGTIRHFKFGCSTESSDNFSGSAGVLGLSRGGPLSQIPSTLGQIFCYCLNHKGHTGYLLFGAEALAKCPTNTFTSFLTKPKESPSFYFVDLVGITIGKKRLGVSSFDSDSNPNTVLDTGTVITRLPSSVYSALRTEFINLMSKYQYPLVSSSSILDTCYDLTSYKKVMIPKMVLHFKNADVDLDPSGVVSSEANSKVCLAFATAHQYNIIGSTQQKNLGILHDISQNRVGFTPKSC